MLKVNKYSQQGEDLGQIALPECLFEVDTKNPRALLYEVIKMYLANQRQGTSAVLTRAEVQGSSRKLFRQKGTGNARPGNLRTPVRVGGGRAFGPQPKDWTRKIPKKKKRLALKIALSERARANQIAVVDSLKFDKPNTKAAVDLLNKIVPARSKTLLLIDGNDLSVIKSFSNIPYVTMDKADCIFAYEVLNSNFLVITEDALNKMKEVFER